MIFLGVTHQSVPEVLYGISSLVAGFLIIFLPETNGYPMPANKADIKRMYKKLPPIERVDQLLDKVMCDKIKRKRTIF